MCRHSHFFSWIQFIFPPDFMNESTLSESGMPLKNMLELRPFKWWVVTYCDKQGDEWEDKFLIWVHAEDSSRSVHVEISSRIGSACDSGEWQLKSLMCDIFWLLLFVSRIMKTKMNAIEMNSSPVRISSVLVRHQILYIQSVGITMTFMPFQLLSLFFLCLSESSTSWHLK